GAVRGDLLLDPGALLAAGDAVPGGLRPGRGADAAGGRPAGGRGAADPAVRLGHRGHLVAAVAAGHRLAVRRLSDRAPRRGPDRGAPAVRGGAARREGPADAAVPPVEQLPGAAVPGDRGGRGAARALILVTYGSGSESRAAYGAGSCLS